MRPTTQIEYLSIAKMLMTLVLFPSDHPGYFHCVHQPVSSARGHAVELPFQWRTFLIQNRVGGGWFCWLQQTASSENNLVKYAALQSCSERELFKCHKSKQGWLQSYWGGGVVVSCNVPSKQWETHFHPRPGILLNVRFTPSGCVKGCSSSEAAGAQLLSARTKPPSAAPGTEDTINLAVCWAARPLTYLRFD